MVSKADDTATFYAQGGIAVVLPFTDDTVDSHVADTSRPGPAYDPDAVRSIVADGYQAVADLTPTAPGSTSAPGQWALTREGGHSGGASCTPAATPPGRRSTPSTTRRDLDIRRKIIALQVLHDGAAVTGCWCATPTVSA